MKAENFNRKLTESLKRRKDIIIQKYGLKCENRRFGFLKIESKNISKKDKIILISAGFHGNEPAGPLTILRKANKIIDHCHKNGLKIIIYPLINPSGFEINSRYNADNDKGDFGNNDFMRYELNNGKIVDDLGDSKKFKNWHWSSDKKIKTRLPQETKLLHKLLKNDPLKQIVAAIDLHQDPPAEKRKSAFTYQYSFKNKRLLGEIAKKVLKILPLLRDQKIDTGFTLKANLKTDKNGFIVRHDGSITDLFYRLGTKHPLTIETSTTASLNKAILVNLIWILNIINLVKIKNDYKIGYTQ